MKNKERLIEGVYLIAGALLFSLGVQLFLQPLKIFSGGFLGLSQVLRDILKLYLNISFEFDISGIINAIINIVFIVFAYFNISKIFSIKTCVTIIVQSFFITIINVQSTVMVDPFTNIVVGSLLVAFGTVLVFDGGGSGAGLDIIGIYLNQKNRLSISKVYLMFNISIYVICMTMYDIETTIYSMIHAIILSFFMEKIHKRNINIQATIISENRDLGSIITREIMRGVTVVNAVGEYTKRNRFIYIVVLTKNKVSNLKQLIRENDEEAFVVIHENIAVQGNFSKKLV